VIIVAIVIAALLVCAGAWGYTTRDAWWSLPMALVGVILAFCILVPVTS
jgi:hypothetical protein